MRIEVADIPRQGRELRFEGEAAASIASEALDATIASAQARLLVRRQGAGVVVEGSVRAEGERPCDRCGRPAALSVAADERLVYEPRSKLGTAHGEIELDESDLDVGFFDGSGLEVDDVLSELFALAAPFRVTCARLDCDEATQASAGEGGDEASGEGRTNPFAALKDRF